MGFGTQKEMRKGMNESGFATFRREKRFSLVSATKLHARKQIEKSGTMCLALANPVCILHTGLRTMIGSQTSDVFSTVPGTKHREVSKQKFITWCMKTK